jgi:hypothetical protein
MELPYIGRVKADNRFPRLGLLVSKPVRIPFLGNKACRFELKQYRQDSNPQEVHTAIANILSASHSVLTDAQDHLYDYYRDMSELFAAHGWPAPPLIKGPGGVWEHVHFGDTLYIERLRKGSPEDGIYASLECGCNWEREHGLQIVFHNGLRITKVGPFDGHLTNARAFADPSLYGVIYHRITWS